MDENSAQNYEKDLSLIFDGIQEDNETWTPENKSFIPQAKFYAITLTSDTTKYDKLNSDDWADIKCKWSSHANTFYKKYKNKGNPIFIGFSAVTDTGFDLFAITNPKQTLSVCLKKMTSIICRDFDIDYTDIYVKQVIGKNFFRRVRYADWNDFITDWRYILKEFSIPLYQYGPPVIIWKLQEEPY